MAKAYKVIFIDDRQENVTAAESIGIKSLLFIDAHKLRNDLQSLTIL